MQTQQTHLFDKALPEKAVKYNALRSVSYAIQGILTAFKREPNLALQVLIGISFSLLGILNNRLITAMANLILMSMVISLEMLNSSLETLCDLVHPDYHPKVKIIKDMAAGAVLITAFAWLIVIAYQLFSIFILRDFNIA